MVVGEEIGDEKKVGKAVVTGEQNKAESKQCESGTE